MRLAAAIRMFAVKSMFSIDKVLDQQMGDHIDAYPRKKGWQQVKRNRQLGHKEEVVQH